VITLQWLRSGSAEILRLVNLSTDPGWTNGSLGIRRRGRARLAIGARQAKQIFSILPVVWFCVLGCLTSCPSALYQPWGRTLRATVTMRIRRGAGVHGCSTGFRLQTFVIVAPSWVWPRTGRRIIFKFLSRSSATEPLLGHNSCVWVMLMAGGSGNNKGGPSPGLLVIWSVGRRPEISPARPATPEWHHAVVLYPHVAVD